MSRPAPKKGAARRPAATPARAAADPAPSTPRVLHRGTLTRIEFIHEQLCLVRAGRVKVTAASLARDLGRSRNTILDDLHAMKLHFRAPIAWDVQRGTYYYAEAPHDRFELRPRVHLDAVQVLSLMAASCLSGSRAFPLGRALLASLRQIAPLLDGAISLAPDALQSALSSPEDPATDAEGRHFAALYEAIVRRREVRMVYRAPARPAEARPRAVQPLHLLILAEGCLLIAHDTASRQVRNFALERIASVEFTAATFEPPKNFALPRYLAGRVGRFAGEPRHEVRVRFAADYVPYVRQRPWQTPQALVDLPDGSAEAIYRVAHPREIEQRVLAAGGLAEVLSPPEVRARLQAAAQTLTTRHA